MTWQPIETAPKDGTHILGLCTGAHWDVGEDCYSPRNHRGQFVSEIYWDGYNWSLTFDANMGADVDVALWMPLPEPPK